MQAGKRNIYWETSVFLAWLQDEQREAGVMEGIEDIVRQVHSNKIVLFTSGITRIEVLDSRLSEDAKGKWKALFNRRNVSALDPNPRVIDRSHFIRDYYSQRGVNLSVPDTIHLATAIIYKADEMHTLDGAGKRKRPNDLITLDGNVAGYKLKICVPSAVQGSLLTGIPPEKKKDGTKDETHKKKFAKEDDEI